MAAFSSKNNYICGAYFTGKSFLVLEFDNRKNKRTVRTKGEVEVEPFLTDEFEIKDKVSLVESAKKIRKNTKSKTICINKKVNQKDISHFFEIFSVAGFDQIKFVDIEGTLNNTFRKRLIHGTDCFLINEAGQYHFYISEEDKVSLLATADSISEIDLSEQVAKDALEQVLDSKIEVYGLYNHEDFEEIEDVLHKFGYKAVIGNIWQNAFSIEDHIPSIHFKESSKFALPVALALDVLNQDDVDEKKVTAQKSISDDLNPKQMDKEEEEVAEKDFVLEVSKTEEVEKGPEVDVITEPSIMEERVTPSEPAETFVTSIDLPVLNIENKKIKAEEIASYVPNVDNKLFEEWETFGEKDWNSKDNLDVETEEVIKDLSEKTEVEEQVIDEPEKIETEEVIVEEETIETSPELEKAFEEIMEDEIDEVKEVDVVEDSKVISKEDPAGENKKGSLNFLSKIFGKNKKVAEEEVKPKKKKRKKKSKNAKKHKKK